MNSFGRKRSLLPFGEHDMTSNYNSHLLSEKKKRRQQYISSPCYFSRDADTSTKKFKANVALNKYSRKDLLFIVCFQNNDQRSSDIHPLAIDKKMNKLFAKDIEKLGKNKVRVTFTSFSTANSIVDHPLLASNKLIAFIPASRIMRMGVVKDIPVEMDEIASSIESPKNYFCPKTQSQNSFRRRLKSTIATIPHNTY